MMVIPKTEDQLEEGGFKQAQIEIKIGQKNITSIKVLMLTILANGYLQAMLNTGIMSRCL